MRKQAYFALFVLTGLNFLNYVDRNILFAVTPLIQAEFPGSNALYGFLTTAFFLCYMVTAPIAGVLADRFTRKWLVVIGAIIWSAATLLTAATNNFTTLLIRHTIVGIGEATFVTIAPSFIADLFEEDRRGRMLSVFYIAFAGGSAAGYILGGQLGQAYGWRMPFYVAAVPGFLLAAAMMFVREPVRGAKDAMVETTERVTLRGLVRNKAFWTATLGMALLTFAMGGMQVWIPKFLVTERGMELNTANLAFGGMTLFNGIVATLAGGWIADALLKRTHKAYYVVSALAVAIAAPVIVLATHVRGSAMLPAIFIGEFFLLLNTGPLNTAVVDSVSYKIRATAISVNIFVIHLLGDALSPTLIGKISDHSSLETAFLAAAFAVALAAVILFVGMRYAPVREQTVKATA